MEFTERQILALRLVFSEHYEWIRQGFQPEHAEKYAETLWELQTHEYPDDQHVTRGDVYVFRDGMEVGCIADDTPTMYSIIKNMNTAVVKTLLLHKGKLTLDAWGYIAYSEVTDYYADYDVQYVSCDLSRDATYCYVCGEYRGQDSVTEYESRRLCRDTAHTVDFSNVA